LAIAHAGDQEGVAIELTPVGCRATVRYARRALWDTSVEFDEEVGFAGTELCGNGFSRSAHGMIGSQSATRF